MNKKPVRKSTRSQVWPDIVATIKVQDTFGNAHSRSFVTITGRVEDLGAAGMFLLTSESVPVPARAEIMIDFDPKVKLSGLRIIALGETVRKTGEGVGIKFNQIDMRQLQKCIVAKMNRMESPGMETEGV